MHHSAVAVHGPAAREGREGLEFAGTTASLEVEFWTLRDEARPSNTGVEATRDLAADASPGFDRAPDQKYIY